MTPPHEIREEARLAALDRLLDHCPAAEYDAADIYGALDAQPHHVPAPDHQTREGKP